MPFLYYSIVNAFQTMLDGFSKSQWKGDENGNAAKYDVADVFSYIGDFDENQDLKTWMDDEIPKFPSRNTEMDHHHNITRKMDLLPPTARGQVLRQLISYFYFRAFLGNYE